jgi:ArsR family transcriptional regulator
LARGKAQSGDTQQDLYRRHADLCKVFSHATRLQVLNILREQEMSVSDLARELAVGIGNLSQHLNMMKQRRVLDSRKEGNNIYYRLANPRMVKAFDLIREILFEQLERESNLMRHMKRMELPAQGS